MCGPCTALAVWKDEDAEACMRQVRQFFIDVVGLTSMADEGKEEGDDFSGELSTRASLPPGLHFAPLPFPHTDSTFDSVPVRLVDRDKMAALTAKHRSGHTKGPLGLTQTQIITRTVTTTTRTTMPGFVSASAVLSDIAALYADPDDMSAVVASRPAR